MDREPHETTDEWLDEIDEGDDGDFEFDCGLTPDGFCQLAGTEECDWECPVHAEMLRDAIRNRERRERRKRQKNGDLLTPTPARTEGEASER